MKTIHFYFLLTFIVFLTILAVIECDDLAYEKAVNFCLKRSIDKISGWTRQAIIEYGICMKRLNP